MTHYSGNNKNIFKNSLYICCSARETFGKPIMNCDECRTVGQFNRSQLCVLTGANSLATLRRFIGENFTWLMSELLQSATVNSSATAPALSASQQPHWQPSKDTARPTEDFNPLKMFAGIGSSHFDHVRIANMSLFSRYSLVSIVLFPPLSLSLLLGILKSRG